MQIIIILFFLYYGSLVLHLQHLRWWLMCKSKAFGLFWLLDPSFVVRAMLEIYWPSRAVVLARPIGIQKREPTSREFTLTRRDPKITFLKIIWTAVTLREYLQPSVLLFLIDENRTPVIFKSAISMDEKLKISICSTTTQSLLSSLCPCLIADDWQRLRQKKSALFRGRTKCK